MVEPPTWQVICVVDPDGGGSDFGYTVGLTTHGLPELHLWARPTDGHDPGADWSFDPAERGLLLNRFAEEALAGQVRPGHQIQETFDAGTAAVKFLFGDPCAPDTLDAFEVPPGATVIPIRWSLERSPQGALTGFDPDAHTEALDAYCDIVAELDAGRVAALPARWQPQPVENVSFAADQPLGPATALVLARAAQVATAERDTLVEFLHLAMVAGHAVSPRHVLALTASAARPVGRSEAIQATLDAAEQLTHLLTRDPQRVPAWRAVLDQFTGPDATRAEWDRFAEVGESVLRHAVAALLCTEVVADVSDAETITAGYGPWLAAYSDNPIASPGPAWDAPTACSQAVRDLLAGLTKPELLALADAHHAAMLDDTDTRFAELFWWLRAQAVIGPAAAQPLTELLEGTPAGEAVWFLATLPSRADELTALHAVVATLTAMFAVGDRLDPVDRDIVLTAYLPALPALRDLLTGARPHG